MRRLTDYEIAERDADRWEAEDMHRRQAQKFGLAIFLASLAIQAVWLYFTWR